MKQAFFRYIGVLAVLAAIGLGVLAQGPCTITVQDGQSIQAAIDAAPEGAVICLVAATWEENITIEKNLALRGAGADDTIIKGSETGESVIYVESDNEIEVRIEGLTVAEAKGSWVSGILVGGRAHVFIADSTIADCAEVGISVWDSAQVTIANSTITGNGEEGIVVWDFAEAVITGSTIAGNGWDGIYMVDSAQAIITGSTIAGNGWEGIFLEDEAQALITGSTIEGNGVGIGVVDLARATIEGATIEGNEIGVAVGDSARATIEGSTVVGNEYGIVIGNSAHVTLVGNRIAANDEYGFALYEPPCFDDDEVFQGHVAGRGNVIPGPDEPDGNRGGAVCPADLAFLTTAGGGELDRR